MEKSASQFPARLIHFDDKTKMAASAKLNCNHHQQNPLMPA